MFGDCWPRNSEPMSNSLPTELLSRGGSCSSKVEFQTYRFFLCRELLAVLEVGVTIKLTRFV